MTKNKGITENLDAAFDWLGTQPDFNRDIVPLGWETHVFAWHRRKGKPWQKSIEKFVRESRHASAK